MSIPNNWYLVYKILLGMGIQIIFTRLKDLFVNRQRQRELKEIKSQIKQMKVNLDRKLGQIEINLDRKLGQIEINLDRKLVQIEINLDRKIEQMKSRVSFMQADIEYYRPQVYQPMDLPSPKSN